MSDVMLDRLRDTEGHCGRQVAEVIAIGNIDGCFRYLHGDEASRAPGSSEQERTEACH